MAACIVKEAELQTLAEERGQKVQAWFSQNAISAERIFLFALKLLPGGGKSAGTQVQFSLR